MIAGIAIGVIMLTITLTCSGLFWCHHEKLYCFSYRLTPAERVKRKHEEAEQRGVAENDTDFRQQRFDPWIPRITPMGVVLTYASFAIWGILVGIVAISASGAVVTTEMQYDNLAPCAVNLTGLNGTSEPLQFCTVQLEIPNDMEPPIYIYYKLTDFYQNHRTFVKSVDPKQLRAEDDGSHAYDNCDPLIRYGNWHDKTGSYDPSLAKKRLYPCGLVAQSFFTDFFFYPYVCPANYTSLTECEFLLFNNWQKRGIAWDTDLEVRFIPRSVRPDETTLNPRGFQMPDIDDEELVVWMRSSTLPTFTKLYRKVNDRKLLKGEILSVRIGNTFPSWKWQGKKAIVVSTANFLGGSSSLGTVYLVVGIISAVMTLFFYLKTQQMIRSDIPTEKHPLPLDDLTKMESKYN